MTLIHVRRKGAEHVTYVESDKEPDKEYELATLPDGNFACACMAYVFNKAKPKTCKHITAYEAAPTGVRTRGKFESEVVQHKGETFTFKTKRAISFSPI